MTLFIIAGILAIIVGFMIYGAIVSQEWHQENRGQETITETENWERNYNSQRKNKQIPD